MDISIIVCTWNNARRLEIALEAHAASRIPPGLTWQLVIVNSGGTDATPAVVRRWGERLPLVYVDERRPGLSRAKNAGLQKASGDLLIFADDDVCPCPEWVASYWAAYRERRVGSYFGGPIVSDYEGGPPRDELLRIAGHAITGVDWGPEPRALAETERVYPANWACPAAPLRAAGPFDLRLGLDASLGRRRVGETFDMMDRLEALGLGAWYVPGARVTHFVPRAKCTIGYLGENAEAVGAYSVRAARPHRFLIKRPTLRAWCERERRAGRGVPWALYVKTATLGAHWIAARAFGLEAYAEYLALRFCLGRIRGYRELGRAGD